ncbi:MAG: (d)CMP kinase [Clostridiales bacterium]|jgi:cytidylate kinase|nr:(d)CMP kinase [Clostridiales bacterium]
MGLKIAIDGPSGAGKSTIAKTISKEFGFVYLDTGAMYRSFAWYALSVGANCENIEDMLALLGTFDLKVEYIDSKQQLIVNGKNITDLVRTPEISTAASQVAAIPQVRQKMVTIQKKIANNSNVVMDGRDIGTCVLPDADLKIFLIASVSDRAKRRYEEMIEKGDNSQTYDQVKADMIQRDSHDSARSHSPLKQADDAILVDTTGYEVWQTADKILGIVRSNLCLK